ncbi:MAG: branched-chain amino acid ABC transporter permease [Mesorhizobium sp.]
MTGTDRAASVWLLHLAVIAALFVAQYVLPDYHNGILARVMVLACFAMGYNILFGYTGLLSLGHAMFFAAGLYGAGLPIYHYAWHVIPAFGFGIACGAVLALVIGVLALRTTGVAFMIVTLMFAQVGYLTSLWMGEWTRGDEGLTLSRSERIIENGWLFLDLTQRDTRYVLAWLLLSIVLVITLFIARSPFGRVLVAIRENEERTRMLGFNTYANKLSAVVISGAICAAAGAAYALLFGYMGATFASIQYSILPLLWVLLGGAATVLGPILGTILMFYLAEVSNDALNAWFPGANLSQIGVVGVALVLLVLFFPKGILGTVRERWLKWLP